MYDHAHEINIRESNAKQTNYIHKISQGHFGAQCATVPVFLCLDPGARGAELWAPPLWVAFLKGMKNNHDRTIF